MTACAAVPLYRPRGRVPITALLLCLAMLPSALFYVGIASSMALGTVLSAVIFICLSLSLRSRFLSMHNVLSLSCAVLLAILLHLMLASISSPIDFQRAFTSLLLLYICLGGSAALANLLTNATGRQVRAGASFCLQALGLVAFMGIFESLQPSAELFAKPSFPFTEPSHVAIVAAPFLIFTCAYARPAARIGYLLAALGMTALLQNLTLAAVCILAALLCLRLKHLIVVALIILPLLLTIDLNYYLTRFEFNEDTQNISALAYLQGWQLLVESWQRTYGIGLGFQQLGVFGTDVPAADIILALTADSSNILDGGFTLSKIVSEFGLLGLFLISIYAMCTISAAFFLRSVAYNNISPSPVNVFAASAICGYSIELFFRGFNTSAQLAYLWLCSFGIWGRYKSSHALIHFHH